MPFLSYRYRLLPNKAQHAALARIREEQRQLYNAALEERIGAWKKAGKLITLFEQYRSLTVCRRELPEMAALPTLLQRWTLKQLDFAYSTFFRKLRAGEKAGFPRFRSKNRFRSFGFAEYSTIKFDGRRVRFRGMPGGLKVHVHRPLPAGAQIKSCVFHQDGKGWTVILHLEVATAPSRPLLTAVGVDLGLSYLATLSDGTKVPNPRCARRTERALRRKRRAMARCERGSNRRVKVVRQLARVHQRAIDAKVTSLHQLSAALVKEFDLIAFERLDFDSIRRGPLAAEVLEASWARLIKFTKYKAENAGAMVVDVDAPYTSQDCSRCGTRPPKRQRGRTYRCPSCDLVIDRDVNAARNILARAVARPEVAKLAVASTSPGNIAEARSRRFATLFAVSIPSVSLG